MNKKRTLLLTGIFVLLTAASLTLSCKKTGTLSYPGWNPYAREAIQKIIDEHGIKGAKYDPENRPYIVLDWDNTSIFNDCAHNLFVYQIDRVAFKLTPKEFSKIIRKGITFPRKPFPAEYRNQNGRAITPEMICRDLESHYEYLFENFKVNAASRVVEKDLIIMHKGDIFQDFKAKMIFYFSALHEAYPPRASYEWALFSFVNYTPAEVRAFAEYGHSYNLRLPLKMVTVSSPSDFTTKTGPVSVSYKQGITLQDGIKDLIRTAQANKIDMMVCSTSLESVVKAIACNPKYGYGIPEENIIGMRLALTDGKLMAKYRDNYEFNYREGKKKNVENIFARARGGKGPLIVAGDADTDWEMMSQFKDTRLGLILNRYKSGKGIARGAAQAVEAQEKKEGNPRYVLQGRNENTGKWVTGMKVLLLGEVDEAENYKLLNK